jgi:hypothetical protein
MQKESGMNLIEIARGAKFTAAARGIVLCLLLLGLTLQASPQQRKPQPKPKAKAANAFEELTRNLRRLMC